MVQDFSPNRSSHQSGVVAHRGSLAADAARMRRMLTESPMQRGSARARRVLDALDAHSESACETRTRLLLSRMRLPLPSLQVAIGAPHGRYRTDFAWEELGLVLEFDGRGKYFEHRPTDEALFAERCRERALVEQGWSILRIEWQDLADPQGLERRIRAAMDRALTKRA